MPLSHILSLALKLILVNRLQKILYCSEKGYQSVESGISTDAFIPVLPNRLDSREILPRRVSKNTEINYVSAIALKLAHAQNQSAAKLGVEITDILACNTTPSNVLIASPFPDQIWQRFTIQSPPSGLIHFKLNAAGLHEWLNLLSDRLSALSQHHPPNSANSTASIPTADHLSSAFPVLYTHARCCTLLRLGMHEQLIQLVPAVPDRGNWAWTKPEEISWLSAEQQFRCTHATEQRLIAQIIDTLDELACATDVLSSQQLWHLAHCLSRDFQAFHASCRLFGAIKTGDRALAQARLGLVFITQALLYWLLQDWLHIAPPIEL